MDKEPKKTKVLKVNNDGLLTADFQEFIAVMDILKNQYKQFLIFHKKLCILKKKIWDCIQQHHDPIEYGYKRIMNIIKTIQ